METANIATAKNQFSRLLQRVKRGETVLITDRDKPVAQLGPVRATGDILARLVAEGVVRTPEGPPLDVKAFLKLPRPKLSKKASLSGAILEERQEGA